MPRARQLKRKDFKAYTLGVMQELWLQYHLAKTDPKKARLRDRIKVWEGRLEELGYKVELAP